MILAVVEALPDFLIAASRTACYSCRDCSLPPGVFSPSPRRGKCLHGAVDLSGSVYAGDLAQSLEAPIASDQLPVPNNTIFGSSGQILVPILVAQEVLAAVVVGY